MTAQIAPLGRAGERVAVDAVTLEVMRNTLESIADEMGAVLRHTSYSPNIKERMDASCALFDANARLIAQAEHVPVHLGSMLRAVSSIISEAGELHPGDIVVTNDPFIGGAHLPDVTMIAPVYFGSTLSAFVAVRAHHADVGGMQPGSMPGKSTEIYQEGLILPPVKLYAQGVLQEAVIRIILANVRTAQERRGDINAQVAALRIGERRLMELADDAGPDLVIQSFDAIMDYAERRVRKYIARLPAGTYHAVDVMDDDGLTDSPVNISVTVSLSPEHDLTVDFAGTSPQRAGNINAVAPMTYSAVFFAVKMLTEASVPVNAGTFRAVEIRLPEDCVLNARHPAAVCAGNTETTQRVADTVLRAFAKIAPDRIPAAGEGTMNTLGIGGIDPRTGCAYSYIETIGGGQGGRPMGPGQDGIQCNMTNTMNTPIEALEHAYPLRVESYELREGSGGAGAHPGGRGIIRAITVLGDHAQLSIQSDRRRFAPYGLNGGANGVPGRNAVIRQDGTRSELPGKGSFTFSAGDSIVIETPGGGGWGDPDITGTSLAAEMAL